MQSNVGRVFSRKTKVCFIGLLGFAALAVACSSSPSGGDTGSSSGQGGSGGAGAGGSAGAGGEAGSGGGSVQSAWTVFTESADTQKIYVSSSDGDDNNDGSAPEKAVKTIAKGTSLLRDGKPDWMLLKRGDVWLEGLGEWKKSGRSATEPMVVMTYGESLERPTLKTGAETALSAFAGPLRHLAFVGLHLYAHTRDPQSADFKGVNGNPGIQWLAGGEGLLFEDMKVQFYSSTNITVQGAIKNFKLRRSIIVDSYSTNSHSQGIYVEGVSGILIEENLFDHNGWNDHPQVQGTGAEPTIFNHNMYVQASCSELTIRGNITTRASSHGFQARPGGIVENNLVIDNPIGFSYGLVLGDWDPKAGGVTGRIAGNVVRDSGDINAMNSRGVGIQIGNIQSAVVEDNILAHDKSVDPYGVALEITRKTNAMVDEKVENLTIQNNIIYDWRGGIRFATSALSGVTLTNNDIQAPLRATELVNYFGQGFSSGTSYANNRWFSIAEAGKWFTVGATSQSFMQWLTTSSEMGATNTAVMYTDAERKLGTYHETLGQEATFDAYLAEVRKQSQKNWRPEYTAMGPIAYIRQGFGKK